MINIFACIDKNLQDKIFICYNSIKQNTKEKFMFYLICFEDINDEKLDEYESMGFIVIGGLDLNYKINLEDTFVKSKAMYLRFYFPEFYPYIDKAIYTEADSVYDSDILEHYNIDIGNNYVGTVKDWFSPTCKQLKRWSGNIEGCDDIPAYLTGNMIINCKAWRENKITQKLENIVKENNIRVNLAMSIVCQDKIFELPKEYCFPANYEKGNNKVKIYHWSGNRKPWNQTCLNQEIFDKYR